MSFARWFWPMLLNFTLSILAGALGVFLACYWLNIRWGGPS
jgi:hypothetical protein